MIILTRTLFFFFATVLFSSQAAWSTNYQTQSLGANGYDVVAYHTQNKAVPGVLKYNSYIKGVTYLFASQEDKALFDTAPDKYLPAYGGYCAMAMTLGKKHLTNPEAFLVVNGKLYLNKADVRAQWLEDVPGNIKRADAMWKKLENIDPAQLK